MVWEETKTLDELADEVQVKKLVRVLKILRRVRSAVANHPLIIGNRSNFVV